MSLIGSAGSWALNTELPATIMFAPALAAASMVLGPRPPSTSMSSFGYLLRKLDTFGIMSSMKDWPPNPGSTVIMRTISTASTSDNTHSTGVFGFNATPTFIPTALICLMSAFGFSVDSK
eukprot:Lithocolla_globosa_v1_NODE_6008_length_1150_cov_22.538813.p2 type:complete len:120 gc:universal NODE_6008_length_1150_cov_22.538813:1004-645(-)